MKKKLFRRLALFLAAIALVLAIETGGAGHSHNHTAKAATNTTCCHVTWRRTWAGPWWELPKTYFCDYCIYCGTVFGYGWVPGPPVNLSGLPY